MATCNAEGARRQHFARGYQSLPLEDSEGWPGCAWVSFFFVDTQLILFLIAWFASYGHGVLRNPDPRFIALQEFCDSRPELKGSPIIDLVNKVKLPDFEVDDWLTML